MTPTADLITIATRAYAVPATAKEKPRRRRKPASVPLPDIVLVFDCETTIDAAQALTFGAYRVYAPRALMYGPYCDAAERVELIEEGLFYADDLPATDRATLQRYCAEALSDAPTEYGFDRKPLEMRPRREFVDRVLYPLAFRSRGLCVGFNLPFDISRIAVDASDGRKGAAGGFSFTIWEYERDGKRRPHPFRARITVKPVGVKGALIQFAGAKRGDDRRQREATFRGHFLDLHTLAFALTNRGFSLASACEHFGVEHGKDHVEEHGKITADYITYCRHDVRATWELFERLRAEFDRHPIALQATKAYSPASIGKSYLGAMRIRPPSLSIADEVGLSMEAVFGACMQAYYGGRAECRIRRTPVPVVYVDFLSMYPTVNSLMGLWDILTADALDVVDATDEITAFLGTVTADALFDPTTWRTLPAIVQIRPGTDVLPVRAQYDGTDWQIGLNELQTADALGPRWYTLADCVAATLLGGRPPPVVRALRFVPRGRRRKLHSVALGGQVPIAPRRTDFFRAVIEERARVRRRMDAAEGADRTYLDGLQTFLKIMANAASYGIFVELNRKDGARAECAVWTGAETPFTCAIEAPEEPGALFFPPLATLITGAARLMLALLERSLSDAGGAYVFCDTDSMAIVASEAGGLVPCVGGPERLPDGREAVKALPWANVAALVERFAALNPYDRDAVPGSVLKVEDVNRGADGRLRELWAYAISAKRYSLYTLNADGEPVISDAKAHGLGHVLAPDEAPTVAARGSDEGDADDGGKLKPWMKREWAAIVREALGLPVEERRYLDRLACGRIGIRSPLVWHAFDDWNRGKPYAARVKPFGFLVTAHVAPFGHPADADPTRFRLVAPFERNPVLWLKRPWYNLYDADARPYRLSTGAPIYIAASWWAKAPQVAVQTYRDLVTAYRLHAEAKSAGPDGQPCGHVTAGLLGRRHLLCVAERFIGKESNRLAEVEDGLIGSPDAVYATYADADAALATLRRVLEALPVGTVAHAAGISSRRLGEILAGRETPERKTRASLSDTARAVMTAGLVALGENEHETVALGFEAIAARYAARLDAVRIGIRADLDTLAEAVGERRTAALCGVKHMTVNRWRSGGPPSDSATLAAVARQLRPHRRRIDRLATLQLECAARADERDALAATLAADPHAAALPWLDRTHIQYDAQAWRRAGRLVPVRSPYARGGLVRRETVDFTDILDRTAQQLGEDVHTFVATLERLRGQQAALARLNREGERVRREYERHRAALRNATGRTGARRASRFKASDVSADYGTP